VDRLLTIPNLISMVRLCCIPWFVWLLFGAKEEYQAAWLLGILGTTDWIDGYVARRFGQVSTVGKVLDPSVDRLLLATAAVSLVKVDAIPLWFGIAALAREVLIGLGGIYLGLKGHTRLDVRYVGKVGAFALMFSFPLFLVADSGVFWSRVAMVIAWFCGGVGLVFAWYSGYGYFRQARQRLKAVH
jgi:cardiolipin synthase (CMP-forming)